MKTRFHGTGASVEIPVHSDDDEFSAAMIGVDRHTDERLDHSIRNAAHLGDIEDEMCAHIPWEIVADVAPRIVAFPFRVSRYLYENPTFLRGRLYTHGTSSGAVLEGFSTLLLVGSVRLTDHARFLLVIRSFVIGDRRSLGVTRTFY
jgi:hypothetical protein